MNVNQATIDLVKRFEGRELEAYLDPVGVVTIGYGYTNRAGFGEGVKMGDVWTDEKAEEMLRIGLDKTAEDVAPLMARPISENEFGAFVSLAYNIGVTKFSKSTALKRFNAGDKAGAAEAMTWWNKAGGKVLRGLVRRREAEADLFFSRGEAPAREKPDVPREVPMQTGTVKAVGGAVIAGGGSIATVIGKLDQTAQIMLVCGALVIAACLGYIVKSRLRKWADGVR